MNSSTRSYPEVEKILAFEGWSVAFLPVGCYEQHGPELPLDTDILQAKELAERLAGRLENESHGRALVLPPIAFTPTDPNRDFAGTVSVSGDAFRAYFESVIRGILDSSYSSVVVVNSHGSVDGLLKEVSFKIVYEQFRNAVSPVRPVLCLHLYGVAQKAGRRFGQAPGRHADWTEFLMTYGLLGEEYYDKSRLQRLREFSKTHDFRVRMPAVLGIPAQLRSVDGVQGEPWPAGERPIEVLARDYWEFVEEELFATMLTELEHFEENFSRRSPEV